MRQLRQNTLGYLGSGNLQRIRAYGGRPKRGLLLAGPPGNGKTSACRWLWQECRRRRWEWRLVSPDDYRAARAACNPAEAVKALFSLEKRGIVFFDDLDIALRDRDTTAETDDQAVFLGALDGIEVREGLVYVFTTNCDLKLIDQAFKRPGRIDVLLHFPPPDDGLRRRLLERWHPEVRAGLDPERAVADTAGFSFAEIEELKNLLILHHLEGGGWDWPAALRQFAANRPELGALARRRPIGFATVDTAGRNGHNQR
jgi:SpoVK/Ycf46/Vps4 family AAA+-type ATPase